MQADRDGKARFIIQKWYPIFAKNSLGTRCTRFLCRSTDSRASERALSAGRAGALCTDAVRAASILYTRSLFGTRDHVEREHAYDTAEYWTKVKSILHYFSVRGERRCITEIRARSLARSLTRFLPAF